MSQQRVVVDRGSAFHHILLLAAKPVVTKHNMQDSQIFESLAKVYEVRCIGEPKPVATWYVT